MDRRLIKNFDWGLLVLTLLLAGVGLVTLHSAVATDPSPLQRMLYVKQLIWYAVGLGAVFIVLLIDYKTMERWAYAIYGGAIGLLVCVLLFGKFVGGSRRWLELGPVSLQPSEVAKIAVIVLLARYYSRVVKAEGLTLRELFLPFLYVVIPFLLIVQQPDLGTGMVVFLISASMTLFVRIEKRTFLCLLLVAVMVAVPGWTLLKDYQRQRILTFLNPDRDPLGAGYHIIQSKIAIGSGQISGKGMMQGTQNTLSFLPEQHTDFIFSVLAEEWGFAGALVLLLLFMALIIWGLNIAYRCKDIFGKVLSVGVTAMVFWQTVINLGMVMGLMPVVGVPLPLISYGGTSILTIMICIGILLNVSMRRFAID